MSSSNIFLLIYISLWVVTLVFYWKKKKTFDVGALILTSYLVYAVLSFFLYNNEYRETILDDLELLPFLYLYAMLLIATLPVLRYNDDCIIKQPSMSLINALASVFVFSSIIVVPVIIVEAKDGLITILLTDSGADELYAASRLNGEQEKGWSIYNLFRIFFNLFTDFGILLFFYYSTLKEKNKFLFVGMGIAILVSLLESLSHGLRTSITMKLLLLVGTYFLFRNHMPKKQKKTIDLLGGSVVGFILFYIITVNISRFSAGAYDSSYQLLNYSGQANLYFNKFGLDAGGIREGDRTCAQFKRWLQFDDVPDDFWECRMKHSSMDMDDSRFSTFVGDFALDFGPVGAAIFICTFSLLFVNLTRNKNKIVPFHQLIIVFFVMEVCIQGGFYLFSFSFNGNLRMVYLFLYYLLFRYDESLKKNRQIK